VRSEPGRGTTFRIYLLRSVSGNGGDAEETASPTAVKATAGTETILVVEDEAAILDITRRFLIRQGYQVLTANSPTEALALAKSHPGLIDVLVTDVVMPGMNGRELWEQLRQLRPTTRCLFMSGYATHVIAPLGVLETGGHIIHKPFTAAMLTGKVRQLLDQGRAPAGDGAIPPVPSIPPGAAGAV
jgi:DNA-binding response OmpR family regulator